MIVRMLAQLAGPTRFHDVGDEVSFPDGAGQRLIDKGWAEAVAPKLIENTVERATRKPKAEIR